MKRATTGTAAMLAGLAALYFSFLHFMQTSPAFANFVGKISPRVADTFSCGCPFCTGKASVCRGNEAFSLDAAGRDRQWQNLGDMLNNKHR